MKKILIFSHEYPPCLGGAGSIAELLMANFSKDKNVVVKVLTSSRTSNRDGGNIRIAPLSKKFWFLAYLPWLVFNAKKYDFIILNDPAAIYSAGSILPKSLLKKTICIIHGVEKHLCSKNLIIKTIMFSRFFKRAIYSAKYTVFVSAFIKEKYKELYDIDPENSKIIHGGIRNHSKKNTSNCFEITGDSEKSSGVIKFLTVSRFVQTKGFDRMFALFKILNSMGLDFEWHIIGDGNYKNEFEDKINMFSDKIFLKGAVDRASLPDIYSKYDYYILLSDLEESFGLSYLEAAASGTIPIGYNRDGVKEAFEYIKYGVLLEAGRSDKQLAQELYSICRERFPKRNECFRKESDFFYEVKSLID